MNQAQLRALAKDGIAYRRTQLQSELAELEKFERSFSSRPVKMKANGKAAAKKKSMWTPERRKALSDKMKALAAQRKK